MGKFQGILESALKNASNEQLIDGYNWYNIAKSECEIVAKKYNTTLPVVAGVVAALSPGCKWDDNIKYATFVFEHGIDAFPHIWSYNNANKFKALHISLTGDCTYLRGKKVLPFYRTILDHSYPFPVIDTWIYRLFGLKSKTGNDRLYFRKQESINAVLAFQDVSLANGLLVSQLQAISWLYIRNEWGY